MFNKANNRVIRDTIIPCTHTSCYQKDCPNYVKEYKKGSFFFPDCINNPNRKENGS